VNLIFHGTPEPGLVSAMRAFQSSRLLEIGYNCTLEPITPSMSVRCGTQPARDLMVFLSLR
jgi:hypothetical protein